MNEKQLKIFIAAADCGSFSKAEQQTFMTKQAIIKQIDAMEFELGFELFKRTQKGCILTDAGHEYYVGAKKILRLCRSVAERSQKLAVNRQVIRIANPPHPKLVLADAINEFAKRYPDIQQIVSFSRGSQIIDDIISGEIDAGERIYHESLNRPELSYTKICSMPMHCIMLSSHPLAGREKIKISDLSGNVIGIMGDNQQILIEQIRSSCPDTFISEQSSDELQSIYNICFNNGIYITKAYYATYLSPLAAIPLESGLSRESVLVYRSNPSEIVQKFIRVVEELRK